MKKVFISDIEAMMPIGNSVEDIFQYLFVKSMHNPEGLNLIENFNFYKQGYSIKTRIDVSGQLCVHMTAQLMKRRESLEKGKQGLITVSKYGCPNSRNTYFKQLETLDDKQFASPKDFIQSICNIPNSLATIECDIHDFANHYVGTADTTLVGLWQAQKCIADNIVDEMIVTSFDTITKEQIERLNRSGFQGDKFSEAASSVRIQAQEDIKEGNEIFEILGFGFATNDRINGAVEEALYNALKDSSIKSDDVTFVISNANSIDEFNKYENPGLKNIFKKDIPTLMLKKYLGECFAAYPFLSMGILNKISGKYLPNNLYCKVEAANLDYNKVLVEKNSIFLLMGYDEFGSASVVCLRYC